MAETRRERKCFFPLALKRRAGQARSGAERRAVPNRAPAPLPALHELTVRGRTGDAS